MVVHDHVGLVQGAGVAKQQNAPVQLPFVHYGAGTQRAVGHQYGRAIDDVVNDLVQVEDLNGVRRMHRSGPRIL